jgi:hypothetical protein
LPIDWLPKDVRMGRDAGETQTRAAPRIPAQKREAFRLKRAAPGSGKPDRDATRACSYPGGMT